MLYQTVLDSKMALRDHRSNKSTQIHIVNPRKGEIVALTRSLNPKIDKLMKISKLELTETFLEEKKSRLNQFYLKIMSYLTSYKILFSIHVTINKLICSYSLTNKALIAEIHFL